MDLAAEKVNILLVDDLPDKLLVLELVLEELGQNLVRARSGEEALRHVLEREFAVILLDVNMPGMDGLETAAMIRGRKKSSHTPIIFITAYADEMHTAQGYSLGAVDYILSPVVPEVLRSKVRVFVQLFQMAQQTRRQADQRVALAQEQAARAAAEEATRRSAFLAEASRALSDSLEPDTTLRSLAQLVLPFLADASMVIGLDEQGRPGSVEVVSEGTMGEKLTHREADLHCLPAPLAHAVSEALVSRRIESIQQMGALAFNGFQRSEASTPWTMLCRSALVLPLLARGRTLGVLVLARGQSGRSYSAEDRALAEELAGRAAIALDNARLYQNIQEGDRRKDEFLAMLGHELRNPLAPIRNSVEVIRRLGLHDARLDLARDMIDRQVTHMARLVDDLLDMSRLSRGKILIRREIVDLNRIVAETAEDYRRTLECNGLRLETQLPEEALWLIGDRTRLAQAVGNILNNAAKFTEPGGEVIVTLTRSDGERATVVVRDTGIGIEPAILGHIFEPFLQAERSPEHVRSGLGLGLTLVKGLVELHGGQVQATSPGLGQGTEITVSLPLQARGAEVAETVPRQRHSLSAQRVLVVEDNPDAAESMRILLELMGNQVRAALTGAEGLEAARSFRPGIVLCDIGLRGGMDGYSVARALRSDPALVPVHLIAVTGYGQPRDLQLAREAGFEAHLTKPIDLPELEMILASLREKELAKHASR